MEFTAIYTDEVDGKETNYNCFYYTTPKGYCYMQLIISNNSGYLAKGKPRRISENAFIAAYDYVKNY